MFSSSLRRRVAGIMAAAMLAALPGTTLANVTSQTSETLTVQAQISMTGVPSSLAYGSALAGNILTAPTFTATLSTNNPTGANFNVAATDLTSSNGTIAATNNRSFSVDGASFAGTTYTGAAGSKLTLKNYTAALASTNVTVASRVTLPTNATPGSYTGTLTFRFEVNP